MNEMLRALILRYFVNIELSNIITNVNFQVSDIKISIEFWIFANSTNKSFLFIDFDCRCLSLLYLPMLFQFQLLLQ